MKCLVLAAMQWRRMLLVGACCLLEPSLECIGWNEFSR